MDDNPTYCSTCDNVTARTRPLDGWRWRCLMFPVPDLDHFLGAGIRANEPHGRCMDKNWGQCPDWTPRRSEEERKRSLQASGIRMMAQTEASDAYDY